MAMDHEAGAAELHAIIQDRTGKEGSVDMSGGSLPVAEKGFLGDVEEQATEEGQEPSEHEKKTLRRIGDKFPMSAYLVGDTPWRLYKTSADHYTQCL